MDIVLAVLRYGLVTVALIEAVLIGRALVTLALEKARSMTTPAPTAEE